MTRVCSFFELTDEQFNVRPIASQRPVLLLFADCFPSLPLFSLTQDEKQFLIVQSEFLAVSNTNPSRAWLTCRLVFPSLPLFSLQSSNSDLGPSFPTHPPPLLASLSHLATLFVFIFLSLSSYVTARPTRRSPHALLLFFSCPVLVFSVLFTLRYRLPSSHLALSNTFFFFYVSLFLALVATISLVLSRFALTFVGLSLPPLVPLQL